MHGDHPQFDQLLGSRFGHADYQRHSDRGYYDPPQFWFKPTDFRLSWYKYIGRGMASNKDEIAGDFIHQIMATHPSGMTVEQAFEKYKTEVDGVAESFSAMARSLGAKLATPK